MRVPPAIGSTVPALMSTNEKHPSIIELCRNGPEQCQGTLTSAGQHSRELCIENSAAAAGSPRLHDVCFCPKIKALTKIPPFLSGPPKRIRLNCFVSST
ncbi:hypothetical protein J6590_078626 [Homalodisca vitripennis]|nr:hypothetical protein J6590_078626 [Homalodisca vitripennis]